MSDESLELNNEPSSCDDSAGAVDAHPECSRRGFLDQAVPLVAAFTAATCMPSVAFGRRRSTSRDAIVVIFLRGGLDGLSAIVPYGDPDYYRARPKLGIPPPGTSDGCIDLDGFFGLAPSLQALHQPYVDGKLAFVHATGSNDQTRSHFEAEKHMETGAPQAQSEGNGWLSRHLLNIEPKQDPNPLRAAALALQMPYTLIGAPDSLPVKDLSKFTFIGNPSSAERRKKILTRSYEGTIEPMSQSAADTLSSFDILENVDFDGYVPDNGAVYPNSKLGTGLKSCATLLKADIGTEALMLNVDNFDTHSSQAGQLSALLKSVAEPMFAFYLDNLAILDRITMVVMSEFGRRVQENGSRGTDHGHGNCMMVMGGHVAGGKVLTQWPGLAKPNLDQGDLALTIDYRDILCEILAKRMECTRLDRVFPNYSSTFQGIIA